MMGTFSSVNLPLLLALLVPGFVWGVVHEVIQPVRSEIRPSTLAHLSLSAINFSLLFWFILPLWAQTSAVLASGGVISSSIIFRWFLVTFCNPAILGIITGLAYRKNWWRSFLYNTLGINIQHPSETAWDFAFDRDDPCWVTITLDDDSVIEGLFGDRSLSSTRRGERDVFLEYWYKDSEGQLIPVRGGEGIWIRGDRIKTIEFRKLQPVSEELNHE